MAKRIAINGFGRIGRLTLRNLLATAGVEVVAINDLTDTATLAQLFKFDSSQGKYAGSVSTDGTNIVIDGKSIPTFSLKDPSQLPWADLKVDTVLECTGIFLSREKASQHLKAGAKKVILSAPPKDSDIPTIVRGINDDVLANSSENIISNASCTTNCLAPVVKIINDNWGIEKGFMSTIHAYTADQRLQDAPHSDWRRARTAAVNIVPTSTGAAKALKTVLPEIGNKINASSMRVPVACGSVVELICLLQKNATTAEVNAAFQAAAENGKLKGILQYSTDELVSCDILGNPHSSIFDSKLTQLQDGLLKVTSWYDNEAGYSARMAELAAQW